jgi:septal ring factor EnvC (AmiA/AmiB activator)
MRFGKTLSAIAGLLTGFAIGFLLWGLPVDELQRAFAKTSAELSQTQAWLRDEIRWSEERHEQVTAALSKAQADLAKAQAKIAQANARLNASIAPSASPRQAANPR